MDQERIKNDIAKGNAISGITFDDDLIMDFGVANILADSNFPIIFEECIFNGKVNFSFLRGKDGTIVFKDCKLNKRCDISSFEVHRVTFENCQFYELTIDSGIIDDVFLVNCFSVLYISFYSLIAKSVTARWDEESKKTASFVIVSPDIEEILIFSKNNIRDFRINESKSIRIRGGMQRFSLRSTAISNVSIEPYIPDQFNNPEIKYNQFPEMEFSHNTITGGLTMTDLLIGNLIFEDIESSTGLVRLRELEIYSAFFYDVTIKSLYWNQIHFVETLRIERCDLSSLKMANIKWLPGKKLSDSFIDRKISSLYEVRKKRSVYLNGQTTRIKFKKFQDYAIMGLQYEREVYRQLKAASFANNNNIEGLDFYRNEMRLFWREIRINGGVSVWDRILVFLNRWVSDFGQSWVLPLMWLFVFHTLIYFCIIGFDFTKDYEAFRIGAGQYFELLNPVHKTPDYIKGFNVGLELLLRILDGFFIYHFVRATRKFGKI